MSASDDGMFITLAAPVIVALAAGAFYVAAKFADDKADEAKAPVCIEDSSGKTVCGPRAPKYRQ